MKDYIIDFWTEADTPMAGGQPGPGIGAPTSDGMAGPMSPFGQKGTTIDPNTGNIDPNIANQNQQNQNQQQPDDTSEDPQFPDMPDEGDEKDFETWKKEYFKESIGGDAQKLIDLLNDVRDRDELLPIQRKFIEDNYDIQLIRQNSNVGDASKNIRKNIKEQLDRNNPSTSVVNHMCAVLETVPNLTNIFIKTKSYRSLKGDLHRKYIAGLIGGVQVGSGGDSPDIIYNHREYSIMLSTRFNSEWGDVGLGSWFFKEDDPERFLSDGELKRLKNGSPDEKDVLRKRVILESISKQFETRAFIINVVDDKGTVQFLGWDLSGSLKNAYTDGKIIIKTTINDNSEAFISEDGEIIPYLDLNIYYGKETGEQNEDGTPEVDELPFIEKRNGMLFLTANLKTIKNAATSLQGIVFKELPYNGNPSDLQVLSRCIYSSYDLLMKQC